MYLCTCILLYLCTCYCESGEGLWLQAEAAIQTHSFGDADPQPVITPKAKKIHRMSPKQLIPSIHISLTTTDPCLPSTAVLSLFSRSSQLGPRNVKGSLLFIHLCLAVWVCLKLASGNMVLLQIGAKDFTVLCTFFLV